MSFGALRAFRASLRESVIQRTVFWTYGASFGAAALFVAFAAASFANVPAATSGVLWLLAAAVAAGIGFQIRRILIEQEERLGREQSERNLLQTEIEIQRRSVDDLADGLDIAIFICDPRANILYANRRATELFDFEEPLGRNVLAVTLSHDLERLVVEAHREQNPKNAELVFPYPTERTGLAKAWATPDGRVFLSVYEITDLRRLERVRQDFVANVSHELRTPMTLIRAMAETLMDGDDPELRERYLGKIVSEVDRLSMISQDLLILSAAESNPVRKHACDVAEVFRGVLQQLEARASEKGLALSYEGPEHLTIEANSAQMTQVALNLIENAINYTPQGEVSVQIEPRGAEVQILVRDTGMGIASEHQPRVFERFYRVDKARSRSTGGTGLGLSIVKHIVEAHGGRVMVTSALNQGSTFAVTLPT